MEVSAAQYSKALRKQLGDAGLQGSLQADAFKMLLQYMTDEQADQQVMSLILEQLKQGEQCLMLLLLLLLVGSCFVYCPLCSGASLQHSSTVAESGTIHAHLATSGCRP